LICHVTILELITQDDYHFCGFLEAPSVAVKILTFWK
jgi:hypothetical protein